MKQETRTEELNKDGSHVETIHLSGRLYYGVNQTIYAEVADTNGNPINLMAKHPYTSQILPVGRQAYETNSPTIPCMIVTANEEYAIGLPVLPEALNPHTLLPRPFYQALDGSRHWEAITPEGEPIPNYAVDSKTEELKFVGPPIYNADNKILSNLVRYTDGSIKEGIPLQPHHVLFKNIAIVNQASLTESANVSVHSKNSEHVSSQPEATSIKDVPVKLMSLKNNQNKKLYVENTDNLFPDYNVAQDMKQNTSQHEVEASPVADTPSKPHKLMKGPIRIPAPGYLLRNGKVAILAVEDDGRPLDGYGICPETSKVLPVGKAATEATNFIFSKQTDGKMIEGLPLADSSWDEKSQQGILHYLTTQNRMIFMPINCDGKLMHGLARDLDGKIKPVGFALSQYLNKFYTGYIMCGNGQILRGVAVKSYENFNDVESIAKAAGKLPRTESIAESTAFNFSKAANKISKCLPFGTAYSTKAYANFNPNYDYSPQIRNKAEPANNFNPFNCASPNSNYKQQENFQNFSPYGGDLYENQLNNAQFNEVQYNYIDKPVPTVVSQQLEPVFTETDKFYSVPCNITEPRIIPVNIYVPKPVKSMLNYAGKRNEPHTSVKIPAPHFNKLVQKMNPHLDNYHLKTFFLPSDANYDNPLLQRVEPVKPIDMEFAESFDQSVNFIEEPCSEVPYVEKRPRMPSIDQVKVY